LCIRRLRPESVPWIPKSYCKRCKYFSTISDLGKRSIKFHALFYKERQHVSLLKWGILQSQVRFQSLFGYLLAVVDCRIQ